MARAFVIRPFGPKEDSSGKKLDFESISKDLIEPALAAADLGGGTTGEIVDAGNIREDMFALILEADLVLCDITIHNANVFYELGVRHTARRNTTLPIFADAHLPFDLNYVRALPYKLGTNNAFGKAEAEALREPLVDAGLVARVRVDVEVEGTLAVDVLTTLRALNIRKPLKTTAFQ